MITWRETVCKCKCGLNITTKFHNAINDLREDYGKPIIVLSGARCAEHNASVGGAKQSAHIEGRAVDIQCTPNQSPRLLAFCSEDNLEKYGLFMEDPASTPGWLHISDRPYTTWRPGKPRTFKP